MADEKELEERSERPLPLNVETIIVDGMRKPKQLNPDVENDKLKQDDSDFDTVRDDMETPDSDDKDQHK